VCAERGIAHGGIAKGEVEQLAPERLSERQALGHLLVVMCIKTCKASIIPRRQPPMLAPLARTREGKSRLVAINSSRQQGWDYNLLSTKNIKIIIDLYA